MEQFANTPEPPYYAVIFTALPSVFREGYSEMVARMHALAQEQDGFLGMESAEDGLEITVSYWRDLESIHLWHRNAEHRVAQAKGKVAWYKGYSVRIAKVERNYRFPPEAEAQ